MNPKLCPAYESLGEPRNKLDTRSGISSLMNELREKKKLKNAFAKNQHFLGDRLRKTSGSIVEVLKWETAKTKI